MLTSHRTLGRGVLSPSDDRSALLHQLPSDNIDTRWQGVILPGEGPVLQIITKAIQSNARNSTKKISMRDKANLYILIIPVMFIYIDLFGVRLHGIDRRKLEKIQDSPYCEYRFKYLRK